MRRSQRKPRLHLALALCPLVGCVGEVASEDFATAPLHAEANAAVVAPSADDLAALGRGNRAFAFDLYRQMAKESAGTNLVLSPFSVSSALAMTYAGARGTTADEMKAALHFDLEQPALHAAFGDMRARLSLITPGFGPLWTVNVDNALWVEQGDTLEQPFLDLLSTYYRSQPTSLDFASAPDAARATINARVADSTKGLVPELLPRDAITPSTRLVLTNTVYLDAHWLNDFDERSTHDAPFTKVDGSTVDARMMEAILPVSLATGEGFRAVAIPYGRVYHVPNGVVFDPKNPPNSDFEGLTFVALLPDPGKLADVEAGLNQPWFDALRTKLTNTTVRLGLPRFELRTQTKLPEVLRALGMRIAFTSAADFTGISRQGLSLSDVIHEAVIRVYEGGTVAAAGTAVVGVRSARPSVENVTLDRAFLYAILDERSGQVLFLGRVTDPTAS